MIVVLRSHVLAQEHRLYTFLGIEFSAVTIVYWVTALSLFNTWDVLKY